MNGLKTPQSGFSLLEALIAVVVLSIGLLGLAGMQMANLKSIHNSSQKQQATLLLHDLIARVRNNYLGAQQGYYNTDSIACSSAPSNMCQAEQCNLEELATMDLYQVMCGDNGAQAGIKTALTNGKLLITCVGDCKDAVKLQISWDERISKTNKSAEVSGSNNDGSSSSNAGDSEFKTFELSTEIVVRSI